LPETRKIPDIGQQRVAAKPDVPLLVLAFRIARVFNTKIEDIFEYVEGALVLGTTNRSETYFLESKF
jgi:hypothetical protein